jgi:hypothetical protein
MKTILLFLILITTDVFSQWENINVRPTRPYILKNDTIHTFRNKIGWFTSYNNGDNWFFDELLNQSGYIPIFSPIIDNNYVYFYAGDSHKIEEGFYVSEDYGKSYLKSNLVNGDLYIKDLKHITSFKKYKDLLFLTSLYYGFFISFDNGKNWYSKNNPGIISLKQSYMENPLDDYRINQMYPNVNDIILFKNSIYIATTTRGGGVYKSKIFEFKDSINTILSPITHKFFDSQTDSHKIPIDVDYLNSTNLIEFNNKIYVILYSGGSRITNTTKNSIWYSEDEGDTWNNLDLSNYGIETVTSIVSCDEILYITVPKIGVYMSIDKGLTWSALNMGFNEIDKDTESSDSFYNLKFNENYAFIQNGYGLYRAPLEDCKIVTDVSSVESTQTEPKIFPNPASESITISGVGLGKLELYNTLGQKLIEKEITGTTQINTSTLQTGLYIIKLESGGEVIFEKVIITR